MHVDNAFPSKYLRASDLQGKTVPVTISHYAFEEVGGDRKLILYFEGKTKGLVTNKTNGMAISALYGPEMDDWTGGELLLFTALVDFQGKQTEAIRVRIPPRKPAATHPGPVTTPVRMMPNARDDARMAQAAPPQDDPLDDPIPF